MFHSESWKEKSRDIELIQIAGNKKWRGKNPYCLYPNLHLHLRRKRVTIIALEECE